MQRPTETSIENIVIIIMGCREVNKKISSGHLMVERICSNNRKNSKDGDQIVTRKEKFYNLL